MYVEHGRQGLRTARMWRQPAYVETQAVQGRRKSGSARNLEKQWLYVSMVGRQESMQECWRAASSNALWQRRKKSGLRSLEAVVYVETWQ
jgi:hypothetical protein